MGAFKETGRKRLEQTEKDSDKSLETGAEMLEQSDEIKSLLDEIHVQDTEDLTVVEGAFEGYQESVDGAFEEEPEALSQEVQAESENICQEYGEELEQVEEGASKLEAAERVSDIGRSAAESGRGSLESSAGEYESIMERGEDISAENEQGIQEQKKELGHRFG